MKSFKHYFPLLAILAVLLNSCGLDTLTDLSDAELESDMEVAAPLLYASITLEDLLPDSTENVDIYTDNEGIIHLRYIGERLEFGTEDLLSEIPFIPFPFDSLATDTILNYEVPQEDLTDLNFDLRLVELAPTDIFYIINTDNPTNFLMDYEVEIYSLQDEGSSFTVNIPSGSPPIGTFPLTDPTVYMDSIRMKAVGVLPNGTRVKAPITFAITALDIQQIEGTIYKNLLEGQQDSVTISLVADIIGSGDINFTNPIVKFHLENSFGFGLTGFSKFSMKKKNGEITVAEGPAIVEGAFIPGASTPGDLEMQTFVYTTDDITNVGEFFGTTPEKFYYEIDMYSDFDSVGEYSFAVKESYLALTPEVDLPLEGYSNEFIVYDSLAFDLTDSEDIESASFRIVTDNGLPMIGEIQIYFTDDNYNIIDSLIDDGFRVVADSAPVDGNGLATGKTYTANDIPVDNAKVNKILTATQVIIGANFKTPDATSGTSVTVRAADDIDIRLGVKLKF